MTVILTAFAVLGAWNLYVMQNLLAEQKVAEIGMLKAMGIPDSVLTRTYLVEAALLWLPGLAGGLAVGYAAGTFAEWLVGRDDPEAMIRFSVPLWPMVILVVGSFATVTGSLLLETRKPRRASPMECMQK